MYVEVWLILIPSSIDSDSIDSDSATVEATATVRIQDGLRRMQDSAPEWWCIHGNAGYRKTIDMPVWIQANTLYC